MKTHTSSARIVAIAVMAIVAMFSILAFRVMSVTANPSQILTTSSASASTTLMYLFAAISTSTPLVFDGQADGGFPVDTASLTTCMTASTTGSALSINIEYSQDGITYAQNQLSALATTSPIASLVQAQSAQWQFASTSLAGGVPTGNSFCKIMEVKMPTRYARVFYSLPLLGANNMASSTGVWAQWIGKKENR